MNTAVQDIVKKVDVSVLLARPLSDWRPVLAKECDVFVFEENYIAKRFDAINYKFCDKDEAKEVLVDNLYALLRYKYFPKVSEEIDDRIDKIVKSFTTNLKTTLRKVSFDRSSNAEIISLLPDYCIAFRNGVYNFKDGKWFFKYTTLNLPNISNTIYLYDDKYAITWYFDYDFEPLDIDIMNVPLEDFINLMKDFTKTNRNYCFELLYNISHDSASLFDLKRFSHLCEVLGYTALQSFSQYFILLIGSGQNGKNSLFDGCFTNRLIPRPASNDLDSIENDRFITGALENKYHNIFLETAAKTYTESKMIKALTGSMYQTIESKGVSKYSGVINCKYVFAGNDQDKIKFSDTTTGFRRRINMFEIFYHWDSKKKFLKEGDFYDTSFSDSLKELKDDPLNTTIYLYFAMYGIMSATSKFTDNFKFSKNDWTPKYMDVDFNLKEKIDNFTLRQLYVYIKTCQDNFAEGKMALFTMERQKIYNSQQGKMLGIRTYEQQVEMLNDPELYNAFFAENDVYLSVRILNSILSPITAPITFTNAIKKIYNVVPDNVAANKPYIKVTFIGGKIKIK